MCFLENIWVVSLLNNLNSGKITHKTFHLQSPDFKHTVLISLLCFNCILSVFLIMFNYNKCDFHDNYWASGKAFLINWGGGDDTNKVKWWGAGVSLVLIWVKNLSFFNHFSQVWESQLYWTPSLPTALYPLPLSPQVSTHGFYTPEHHCSSWGFNMRTS